MVWTVETYLIINCKLLEIYENARPMVKAMRNYAEEFAYWYLRLNGFFPITDFVLHIQGGDTDTLALRAPFTEELVKGSRLQEDPFLKKMIEECGVGLHQLFVGVIAEVKSGKNAVSRRDVCKKFSEEDLKYNLRRLGLIEKQDISTVANKLLKSKWILYTKGPAMVHKILFARSWQFKPRIDDVFSFISLERAREFIEERMGLDFKIQDWDKFQSEMIQEIIQDAFRLREGI